MSQKKYALYTVFFLVALFLLTSVAWRDYVLSHAASGAGLF